MAKHNWNPSLLTLNSVFNCHPTAKTSHAASEKAFTLFFDFHRIKIFKAYHKTSSFSGLQVSYLTFLGLFSHLWDEEGIEDFDLFQLQDRVEPVTITSHQIGTCTSSLPKHIWVTSVVWMKKQVKYANITVTNTIMPLLQSNGKILIMLSEFKRRFLWVLSSPPTLYPLSASFPPFLVFSSLLDREMWSGCKSPEHFAVDEQSSSMSYCLQTFLRNWKHLKLC